MKFPLNASPKGKFAIEDIGLWQIPIPSYLTNVTWDMIGG